MSAPKAAALLRALRAHAKGLLGPEAAVELLAGQGSWLARPSFARDFIETVSEGAMAVLDWQGAVEALEPGQLACSTSEAAVLRVAASLAVGAPVDLRSELACLDEHNARLVATAVLGAAGAASY